MITAEDYKVMKSHFDAALMRFVEVAGAWIAQHPNDKELRNKVAYDLWDSGVGSQKEIAEIVGISQSNMSVIVRNQKNVD